MPNPYGYVFALTDAIEQWSASVVRNDPGAFIHRGADLRHAEERSLFFDLIHRKDLQDGFAETGKVTVNIPPIGFLRRLKYELGNLSRLSRPAFTAARLRGRAEFLFLAIHPKFVTFLKPIADELVPDAAFLTVEDKVTEEHLEKHGLPRVSVQQAFTPRLVPRGADTHFVSLCRAFDQISIMMNKIRPSVIVVPEGNSPTYEVVHRAGLQHDVATVYMQHGALGYTNPGFRNWTFADALVWGSRFVEPFAKYNPKQKFTVVGTPASFGEPNRRLREPVRVIGFFLQKASKTIQNKEWNKEWAMMLDFIAWLPRAFPDIEVLVREHPTQPRLDAAELARLGNLPNLRFAPSTEFSLSEVLSRCDVVVAAGSTTLLEAIAVGAIPFILGTFYPTDFPALASEGAACAAPTLELAQKAMTELVQNADRRLSLRDQGERLRPELFASVGKEAAARISAHLRDVAQG